MNSMHSPPAWSMGKSQRGTWKGSGHPGPGSYVPTTANKPRTVGGKIGKDSRDKKRRNSVPGPGSYNSPGKVSTRSPEHGIAGKYPEHLKSRSPGPGAYEGTGQRGYDVTSPSYSFRIKPTENNKQKVPGPGTYENESKIRNATSPSYKIGSADRDDLYPTTSAPGPGTYGVRPQSAYNKDSGPKYPFGSADRDDLYRGNKAPGPGTYEHRGAFDDGKGPTILGKPAERPQSARNPGPGAYEPTLSHKNQGPSYRIGSAAQRDSPSKEKVPGPGNYDPKLMDSSQKVRIGTSVRSPLHAGQKNPGPGSYDQGTTVGEGPKYSMKARRDSKKNAFVPGPGSYEATSSMQSPSYKIGTSTRDNLHETGFAPGPGAYSTRPKSAYNPDSGPKYGFGSSDRDDLYRGNKAPGPGSYNHRGAFDDGKGPTILGKPADRPQSARNPGPGAYDPTLTNKNRGPAFRMGSATRDRGDGRGTGAPGPGNYDQSLQRTKVGAKFGTSVRSPLNSTRNNPGPGNYEYASKIGEGPRFSMKPRRNSVGGSALGPGPGSYEATSGLKSPSYKMGTSTRDGLYRTGDTPGPGSYTSRPDSAGPRFGFGSSVRDPLHGMSKTLPGPGAYDQKGTFDENKGITMAGRRNERNTAKSPGPGAYDPNLAGKNQAPSYGMGTAPRDGFNANDAPGPGNYDPQMMTGRQSVKIGTSMRSPLSEGKRTPGPGTYEYNPHIGEGPRFSMKPRREDRFDPFVPGPGAYDSTSRIRSAASPSYRIGTANRDDLYRTGNTPGPGTYGRPDSASGPKYGFGSADRDALHGMSKTLPGPGSYDTRAEFGDEAKGVSLVPRRPDSALNAASRSPGPGSYNPKLKGKGPAYGIGTGQRGSPSRNDAPGPGNYDPRLSRSNQNVRIGTSVRSPLSTTGNNPGPGTYEYGNRVGEGPRFTMKGRRDERNDAFVPGPGAYEATSRIQNVTSPSYGIGTSNRDGLYRTGNNPGPGTYGRPDSASGPKYGFGSADRDALHGMSKTMPGPGSYDHMGQFEGDGKGITIAGRRTDRDSARNPGPGAYNPSLYTKDNAPAYKLGTAQRDSPSKSGAPGPGNYDPRLGQSGQNIRIGTSVRSPLHGNERTPGPGTYESGTRVGEGPKFIMNPRREEKNNQFVPGPGAYEATSRIQNMSSPSYRIGSATRDGHRGNEAPGPGTYNTRPVSAFNDQSGPKHVFGTADRDALHGMSKTMPGPGAYDHLGSFQGDGKGISIAARLPETTSVRSPGPAAYNPSHYATKDQGPAYRIGSAPRDSPSKDRAPGPGKYEPKKAESGKNVRIGTSEREPLHGNTKTPGPGTYDSPTKVGSGPKYIMNPRREEKVDRYQPGPGAYNPSVNLVKDNMPSAKMGSSSRDDFYNTKSNPGPGQYDAREKVTGPKWGFGSESRSPIQKPGPPGPGSYEMPPQIGAVPKYAYGSAPLKIQL